MGAVKGLFGIKSGAQKSAEAAQENAVNSAKADADAALAERQKRMDNKKRGRASLLTGTEMGTDATLNKTLG
jgi:hypothetical protein